jgi:hypothetical protein
MRAALVLMGVGSLALGLQGSSNPMVKKNVETLQSAKSLKLELSVGDVGGVADDQTLVFSKPSFMKWDTPAQTVIINGEKVLKINKKAKTYSESEGKDAVKAVFKESVPFVFSAFLDADFAKNIEGVENGAKRKVRGLDVTEVKAKASNGKVYKFFFDEKAGMFRGAMVETNGARGVVTNLVSVIELEKGEDALPESLFAFNTDGFTKESEVVAEGLMYADISGILEKNCVGCHSGGRAAKGIDLSSYNKVKGLVVAGDPDKSRLYTVIKSGKMPPKNPLPAADLDKIAQWIKGGAQN